MENVLALQELEAVSIDEFICLSAPSTSASV